MLTTIRAKVPQFLLTPDDPGHYYRYLALHLLGALKFGDAFSWRVAFIGAAVAVGLLEGEVEVASPLGRSLSTESETQSTEGTSISEEKKEGWHYHVEGDNNMLGDVNMSGSVGGNVVLGNQTIHAVPPPPEQ